MKVAAQAENYIQHKQQQQQSANRGRTPGRESVSKSQYDVDSSRREWEKGFR